MANDKIGELLNDFANTYREAVYMFAKEFRNTKTGKDTLSNSDVVKNMKVEVNSNNELSISLYNYFINIETGRKKGSSYPNFDAILAWMKKNNIKPRNRTNGRFVSKKVMTTNELAWLIVRAIQRDGISPRPIFTKAFYLAYDKFDKEFDDLLNEQIDKLIINFIKK